MNSSKMNEQQEWTPEYIAELIGLVNIQLPIYTLKRVADAHNAALAAERKKAKPTFVAGSG